MIYSSTLRSSAFRRRTAGSYLMRIEPVTVLVSVLAISGNAPSCACTSTSSAESKNRFSGTWDFPPLTIFSEKEAPSDASVPRRFQHKRVGMIFSIIPTLIITKSYHFVNENLFFSSIKIILCAAHKKPPCMSSYMEVFCCVFSRRASTGCLSSSPLRKPSTIYHNWEQLSMLFGNIFEIFSQLFQGLHERRAELFAGGRVRIRRAVLDHEAVAEEFRPVGLRAFFP